MRIGHGRVSTCDQHPEALHDTLAAVGCEQIFIDKASCKLASPPSCYPALIFSMPAPMNSAPLAASILASFRATAAFSAVWPPSVGKIASVAQL